MAETLRPETVSVLVDHHRQFLNFLTSRLGNRAAAEELLQGAFLKAMERGGELRDDESAVAWFYRLLRNTLIDFHRHRGAEQRALDRYVQEQTKNAVPDTELEAAVCRCVHGLIPTLKPEYAAILRAVEMQGAGVREVAEQLGITPGNAAVRVHRARQALRDRLEVACGTCTEHGCLDCSCEESPKK